MKVGEICSQIRGVSYKKSDVVDDPTAGYTPVMRANNINDGFLNYDKLVYVKSDVIKEHQLLQKGDVLICASSGSLNLVGKAGSFLDSISSSFGAFCKVLRPDTNKVLPGFFHFYFQSQGYKRSIKALAAGANINNIKNEHLDDLKIPLPSLEEQKRIAAILDNADAVRQKRREAIAQCDEFLKSTFLHMFGDPVTNPKAWDKVALSSLAEHMCDGPFGSNLKSSHYTDSGIRVIRLKNIGVGEFKKSDEAFISLEHYNTLPRNHCRSGDVIFGTLGEPNLRACILPPEITEALNKADCILFRCDLAKVNSDFICALINQPATLSIASSMLHGQTRTRISMGQLKILKLPIPPIDLQNQFAEIAKKTEATKARMQASLKELDDNFNALMQKAFKGEL